MKKVIIPAVVVALAISYYFVSFLPSQQKTKTEQRRQAFLFDKQSECKNICDDLYKSDVKSFTETTVFNPQYAYNDAKNACFYSGGWITTDPSSLTKRVVNCQTNEEVLTYMTIDNKVVTNLCDTCVSSTAAYDEQAKKLMGR